MTESEAKEIVRHRLEQDIDKECTLVWVGDVYAETPDTFIIEGACYPEKGDINEWSIFCAVHKPTGRCGLVPPPPGPIWTKERLENEFSWDRWVIIE